MERRKFTREFKLEAVRLIKDRGVSYTQASVDLGVHQSQLCFQSPDRLVTLLANLEIKAEAFWRLQPLSRRGVALPFVYRATAQPLRAGEYLDVVGD